MYSSDPYPYGDGEDEYNGDPRQLWDDLIAGLNPDGSGLTEAEVDIRNSDPELEVTLYVRLRKEELPPDAPDPEKGQIRIEQSQISKAIHTGDENINDPAGNPAAQLWGKYKFVMTTKNCIKTEWANKRVHDHYEWLWWPVGSNLNPISDNFRYNLVSDPTDDDPSHMAYAIVKYHKGFDEDRYEADVEAAADTGDDVFFDDPYYWHMSPNCQFDMPGPMGDSQATFFFERLEDQDPLEIEEGVHSDTDPKVYGSDSKTVEAESLNPLHNVQEIDSDGTAEGEEYVAVLWRGASVYNDIPTLAKFKEEDINSKSGNWGYEIPDAMLGNADKVSKVTRADNVWDGNYKVTFGINKDRSDLDVVASCDNQHNGSYDICYATETIEWTTTTKNGWVGKWSYELGATVHIEFYAGESKSLIAEPFGGKQSGDAKKKKVELPASAGAAKEQGEAYMIQCDEEIKFFPYIRMTYMTNDLQNAILEEDNKLTDGIPNPSARYSTYVLSEYESDFLPNDAVQVYWKHNNNENTMPVASQQWSLHKKAMNASGWGGTNQVLPGGAIFSLSTSESDPLKVYLITYQTVLDDKAKDYLSEDVSDAYSAESAEEDHAKFVNIAKSVLDNINAVQWINTNYSGSAGSSGNAWGANFQEGSGAIKLDIKDDDTTIDITELRNASNTKGDRNSTNTDLKYYIRRGRDIVTYEETDDVNSKTSDKIDALRDSIRAGDADLDVINVETTYKAYKVFADTSGNVYMGIGEGDSIEAAVNSIKDMNGDHTDGAQLLFNKKIIGAAVPSAIAGNGEATDLNNATSLITNVTLSLTRNKGYDSTAEWAEGTSDGKWYNEAFDGVYSVKTQTIVTVGFAYSKLRTAVLDPALCPGNSGQADLYTQAFLSQFCLETRSSVMEEEGWSPADYGLSSDGDWDRYITTFRDIPIHLPKFEEMYKSQKFYIPNANVQDLN